MGEVLNWPPAKGLDSLTAKVVDCWAVELDGMPGDVEDKADTLLCAEEVTRANRFHAAGHRQAFVASHIALRSILGRYLHTAPSAIAISTGPYGRPFLTKPAFAVHFNLSHSGNVALIAVASVTEVGIDVEAVRPIPEGLDLARRFFALADIETIETTAPDRRGDAFLTVWTRKEAVAKAVGHGLSLPLDRFSVGPADGPAALTWSDGGSAADWTIADLVPAAGYVGAVAVRDPASIIRCRSAPWPWLARPSPI